MCCLPQTLSLSCLSKNLKYKVTNQARYRVIPRPCDSPALVALHLWFLLMKEVAMDQSYSWAKQGFTHVQFVLAELLSKEGME